MENQFSESKQEVDANEIVKSVIESQNKRLDLEKINLELRGKELEFSNQYALAALQAQK